MLNGLDLFSGIGGIGLALSPWVRTVAYCERDRYAQVVILSRIASGELDSAPIWDDVTTLRGDMLPTIDIIFGGFPCQDISTAGRGAGLEGERSGLFFEIMRLVDETRPSFIFLENVAAITVRGLGTVTSEIARRGYDCRWTTLSAAEVGANHKRDRWWLLAYSRSERRQQIARGSHGNEGAHEGRATKEMHQLECDGEGRRARNVADAEREGLEGLRLDAGQSEIAESRNSSALSDTPRERLQGGMFCGRSGQVDRSRSHTEFAGSNFKREWWSIEPDVGRVAHGVPARVERIKCLGNSVVPLCAREAFKELMGINN